MMYVKHTCNVTT